MGAKPLLFALVGLSALALSACGEGNNQGGYLAPRQAEKFGELFDADFSCWKVAYDGKTHSPYGVKAATVCEVQRAYDTQGGEPAGSPVQAWAKGDWVVFANRVPSPFRVDPDTSVPIISNENDATAFQQAVGQINRESR